MAQSTVLDQRPVLVRISEYDRIDCLPHRGSHLDQRRKYEPQDIHLVVPVELTSVLYISKEVEVYKAQRAKISHPKIVFIYNDI